MNQGGSSTITRTRDSASIVLPTLLMLLKQMWAASPSLVEHGIRTAHYAGSLGRRLSLPAASLLDLVHAALLHDIGKVTLPKELLEQEGPLSTEEYVLMQSHPRAGARLLLPYPSLHRAAVLIAHHHERWDGSGYPYGIRGEWIPLGSRILAVADTFDAVFSDTGRCRRDAVPFAIGLLRRVAGSQLDPALMEPFAACVLNGDEAITSRDCSGQDVPPALDGEGLGSSGPSPFLYSARFEPSDSGGVHERRESRDARRFNSADRENQP